MTIFQVYELRFLRLPFLAFLRFPVSLHVTGPEREVVPEELHDERGVLVALLRQRVQLRDGVVKGRLGKFASALRRVHDLVVEHRKVQG